MSGPTPPRIDVAFCSDDKYRQPLLVAVRSLLETAHDPSRLRIWLLSKTLCPEAVEQLDATAREFGATFTLLACPAGEKRLRRAWTEGHISVAAYYRLLLPEILPPEVRRVLYLDCDLLVCHPIEPLWATELQDTGLAAVLKPRALTYAKMGLATEMDYFNSGVLLMDLDRWRAEKIHLEILDFVASYRGRLECFDQDALNHVINGRWTRLDLRWNQQFKFFYHTSSYLGLSRDELEQVRRDPFIVHFTTASKPWHYRNHHPFRRRYFDVLDRTPYAGWRPQARDWQDCVCRWFDGILPPHCRPEILKNVYRPRYHALKRKLLVPFRPAENSTPSIVRPKL